MLVWIHAFSTSCFIIFVYTSTFHKPVKDAYVGGIMNIADWQYPDSEKINGTARLKIMSGDDIIEEYMRRRNARKQLLIAL